MTRHATTRPSPSTRAIVGPLAAIALLAACGDADAGRGGGAEGSGIASLTGAEAEGTGDPAGSEGVAEGSSGVDGGSVAFDLGDGAAEGAAEGSAETGCRRVDFLFVIDNSVSMEDNQASLVGAFPGFIAAIEAAVDADSDFHILVTDTDAWGRCDTVNGFVGHDPGSETCNQYIQTTEFEACDAVRGAGVIHPAGEYASNTLCALEGGARYIGADEPDLAAAFECVATVGVAGHPSERPMESMIAALSPELEGPQGCNAGFLRDDALLVITFVSDDPNREDEGDPQQWYDAVVTAKLGDPGAVVVLGLTPAWPDCEKDPGDLNGAHWAEFVAAWGDHGVHGDVCGTAADYVTFFESAVATIDQACEDYQPPG
ncbi:MAG: hypothetical protein JNK45_12235 [Myxococcales bacterium]|nr:hypothetical protein [Myxococcales bacterium]